MHLCCYSVCTNGAWDCGDTECDMTVKCPKNQVFRENFRMCGRTCSSYLNRDECDENTPNIDTCACEEDQVMDHEVNVNVILELAHNICSGITQMIECSISPLLIKCSEIRQLPDCTVT